MDILNDLGRLVGLALVAAVSLGGLLLLLRAGGAPATPPGAIAVGYPPERFPDAELTRTPALLQLAAVQSRLLATYAALPPSSATAIWLATFLHELRAIMDAAYGAAAVARLYDDAAPLAALSAEVARIEAEVAPQLTRRVLDRGLDDVDDLLAARLAALRLCARELGAQGVAG